MRHTITGAAVLLTGIFVGIQFGKQLQKAKQPCPHNHFPPAPFDQPTR